MNKNAQVETTQVSQATNKNTGKVKTLKNTQERKKAREEQFRNFRINALRRRCKRMGLSDEKIEELVKKLIEQMNAPKEYSILVMLNPKDGAMFKEALAKANIQYKYHGDTYFSLDGNQNVLAKIREIAPPGAKVFPYAKKMESVIPKQEPSQKKPTNNKTPHKTERRKPLTKEVKLNLANIRRAHRCIKKNLKKGEKLDVKKVFKLAEERAKQSSGKVVHLNGKKSSTSSKTLKKAA